MSESYGEREVVKRATQAVLQTQADWGCVDRVEKGRRLVKQPVKAIADDALVAWLAEAGVRQAGKGLPAATLQSVAVLYPFSLESPVAFAVSNSGVLELRYEGMGNQLVSLRT